MQNFVTVVALIGIVIVAASLFSGAAERSGVPLVAALLALGALLGPHGLGAVDIGLGSPQLAALATLGLTLVLFTDAVTLELTEMRRHGRLAWRLLGPGTLAAAAAIAAVAWRLLHLPFAAAALLGAALASTDPVLLRGALRSRALPDAARTGLRLESGMNDIVVLPIVIVSILVLQPHARGSAGIAAGEMVRHAVGILALGPALGALVGWTGIRALEAMRRRFGVRRDFESLYALGLAFAGFAAAEAVGGSGYLAAFAAGLMVASQDVELCDCFLEYGEATAEMLLLLTFVALGASAIWTGLVVVNGSTIVIAIVALLVRTAVLLPLLGGLGLPRRDRRLIALFGPRGLSSLLYLLLPVFAGVHGAEYLFSVGSLVVLLSVVLHGGGIALFLRRRLREADGPAVAAAAPSAPTGPDAAPQLVQLRREAPDPARTPERIAIEEMQELIRRGEPVVIADARSERNWNAADVKARGALRIAPDDAVRAAANLRLQQHATLVVYCA